MLRILVAKGTGSNAGSRARSKVYMSLRHGGGQGPARVTECQHGLPYWLVRVRSAIPVSMAILFVSTTVSHLLILSSPFAACRQLTARLQTSLAVNCTYLAHSADEELLMPVMQQALAQPCCQLPKEHQLTGFQHASKQAQGIS